MLRQVILTATLIGLGAAGVSAQFFSFDAGTDGVNFHLSNFYPAPRMPVVLTLPRVVEPYHPAVMLTPAPRYYHKAIKKAAKAYRKEMRHHNYYASPALMYVGYDYDDDDYDDYMEDVYKARKKAYKAYKKEMKKHYKHHHHHHHHDDD
ncbi:hypothetical protein [Muribaculum intestinale]|uniref:hypothetical protein n=1 Tax=Muribaculum intestinale TaxID=1796646 RepID=UPI0025AA2044|nr:hypothetical protein [Muribaculum intestinale]